MIISASRRTDIPAFFGQWFIERLKTGWLEVINPYNYRQKSIISLEKNEVDAFVFWTRNAIPFMRPLKYIMNHNFCFYFLHTLTPYDERLEPFLPDLSIRISNFKKLTELIGPEKVIWRYDPIIISNLTPFEFHIDNFIYIANQLKGYTLEVKISFIDYYKKSRTSLKSLQKTGWKFEDKVNTLSGLDIFLTKMRGIACENGFKISFCCEPELSVQNNIPAGSCIDYELLNRLFGLNLTWKKDKSQRPGCLCGASNDIGMYDTCRGGCLYCYATKNSSG